MGLPPTFQNFFLNFTVGSGTAGLAAAQPRSGATEHELLCYGGLVLGLLGGSRLARWRSLHTAMNVSVGP